MTSSARLELGLTRQKKGRKKDGLNLAQRAGLAVIATKAYELSSALLLQTLHFEFTLLLCFVMFFSYFSLKFFAWKLQNLWSLLSHICLSFANFDFTCQKTHWYFCCFFTYKITGYFCKKWLHFIKKHQNSENIFLLSICKVW